MVEFNIYLLIVLLVAVNPGLVCLLQWSASSLAAGVSGSTNRRVARQITLRGLLAIGLGLIWLSIGLVIVIAALMQNRPDFEQVMAGGAIGFFGILVLLSTIPIFRLAAQVRGIDDDVQQPQLVMRTQSTSDVCRILGWCWFGLGMLTIVLSMFLFGLLLALVVFLTVSVVVWHNRRNREQHLLSVLTLAVRHGRDLAGDVDTLTLAWSGRYARELKRLSGMLREGHSLGTALQKIPGLLPNFVRVEIIAADQSGQTAQALTEVTALHRQWIKDRTAPQNLSGAAAYLCILVSATCMITGFLCYWIVPKYKKIFEGFDASLPDMTITLINVSDSVAQLAPLAIPAVAGFMVFALVAGELDWRSVRFKALRAFYPMFEGPLVMRHLARIIERGQSLAAGLKALSGTHHRESIALALDRSAQDVEAGNDCWDVLHRRGFLSAQDLGLIGAARRVGNLPWTLRTLAATRHQSLRYRLKAALYLTEPIVVIGMALIVGFICVAMFLPLPQLIDGLWMQEPGLPLQNRP